MVQVPGYGCNARHTCDLRDAHKHSLDGIVAEFGRVESCHYNVEVMQL